LKAKDLLSQLSHIEHSLHNFSFEELTSKEAVHLKTTFEAFKKSLENKIFEPSIPVDAKDENEFLGNDKFSISTKTQETDSNMLIARVSHEIRTPLNGIIGFTDLLKEDDDLNQQQTERVNAIQKASYSLMEIINELLEYSKLSAGIENFESVPFNFRNLVGDVIYLCNTLVSDKEVVLNVSIDSGVPVAFIGDPSKLTQILLNLIGNAIKFVETGSIDLIVQSELTKTDHAIITFSISDTGIGISEENLKHIFDSFKQAETDTYMKYGGSGLGLNIVKQIIERLGGNIWVTSNLGVGTTFEFSIPFAISNSDNPVQKSQIRPKISTKEKDGVRGMRILIFEDNILNQRLIHQRLKTWGCKTYITDNAQFGLNVLANHKIDMVLMDLKMPNMNGFEITKLIRGFEKNAVTSIPIIALSADFSASDKEECYQCGFDDFILKPFSADELLQKLIENKKDMSKTTSEASMAINPKNKNTKRYQFDLSGILDECMGQIELLEELMVLYKQNVLEFIGNVRIHIENSDSEQIAFAAHKIKSGLKMMRSVRLLEIVEQIQKSCHSDSNMENLRFLYGSFLEEYPKAETALSRAMDKLRK
jgi:CheY-like chemotaxis protein/HPt (histidine-containing phosphotransfer) domain-containing protein